MNNKTDLGTQNLWWW